MHYQSEKLPLTAADRRVVQGSGFGMDQGLGARHALLVIDATLKFMGTPGMTLDASVATWPLSCGPYALAAAPGIARCLDLFRLNGWPVFYTIGEDRADALGQGRWHGKNARILQTTEEEASVNKVVSELAPQAGEVVLRKIKPSAFFGTPLASYLNELKIDSLVVTGCTTSGCVRATVVDAFSLNYRVVIPVDAVFDRFELSHEVSLFDLSLKYADVITSDALTLPST